MKNINSLLSLLQIKRRDYPTVISYSKAFQKILNLKLWYFSFSYSYIKYIENWININFINSWFKPHIVMYAKKTNTKAEFIAVEFQSLSCICRKLQHIYNNIQYCWNSISPLKKNSVRCNLRYKKIRFCRHLLIGIAGVGLQIQF